MNDAEVLETAIPDEKARETLEHFFTCKGAPRVFAHVLLGQHGPEFSATLVGALVATEGVIAHQSSDDPTAGHIARSLRRLYAALVVEHNKLTERGLDS